MVEREQPSSSRGVSPGLLAFALVSAITVAAAGVYFLGRRADSNADGAGESPTDEIEVEDPFEGLPPELLPSERKR